MKALVATSDTQGQRDTDYCLTIDGEPVFTGPLCRPDLDEDADCGCGVVFTGFFSRHATTTAIVAEVDLDVTGYRTQLRDAMDEVSWPEIDAQALATLVADELLDLVRDLPVGTVVERRLDLIHIRVCGMCRDHPEPGEEVTRTMQLWQVVVNDTPVRPGEGLGLDEVIEHFRDQVDMTDSQEPDKIEIRAFDPTDTHL